MRLAVIGGGPAGMMAAIAAAGSCQVVLFEKNEKLGKKLFLTGKGRCNITNARDREDFFDNIPKNPRFLYSAFSSLDNTELVEFFENNGLPTKVEQGKRVFPVSDKSSDVIRTLEKVLRQKGVEVRLHSRITDILAVDGKVTGIKTDRGTEKFDRVILASGGMSYPVTGSDGYFHELLAEKGHTVVPVHPSLIPLVAKDQQFCRELMGLSLRNVRLTLTEKGREMFTDVGEMLFTHFGVTGPLVLSASAHIKDYDFSDTCIHIDLKPGLDEKELDERLIRDIREYNTVTIKNMLRKLLPQAIIIPVLKDAGIDPDKKTSSLTKEERHGLVRAVKDLQVKIEKTRKLEEAIITRGGVEVKEVNPSTMESKVIKGLYLAGELLDVDAYTGGYNLQIAFSTGYLAGKSASNI